MSAELLSIYAPAPVTKRGASSMIGYSPKHNTILYPCGRGVVIRNVEDPLKTDIYTEHSCAVSCAQYSPSGYYIASGDVQGNIRIWDTTQKEHPLKIELRVLSGQINDIAWSPDSQRLVVVGDGKERFGAVFVWDAGSSVGEISGHTKPLSSCDFKPTRPFRVATCGEDMSVNWFEGPPFKFKMSIKDHSRFVNCVRFSPDGEFFATGSSDKHVNLYDGKTGEKVASFPDAHKGGVYSLAWSPDSKMLLTVSADKSAIFWDVANRTPVNVVPLGTTAERMLLGCCWVNATPIAMTLDGDLVYLSPSAPAPVKEVRGHNKFVMAMCFNEGKIFSASFDARLLVWNLDGSNAGFGGAGHSNAITNIAAQGDTLYTAGMDNTVRAASIAKGEFFASLPMDGPVYDIDAPKGGSKAVAVTRGTVSLLTSAGVAQSQALKFESSCCAISPDESVIAVGGKDKKLHLFDAKLGETGTIDCLGELTAVRFSHDGKFVATADSSRNVHVWEVATKKKMVENWQYHTAKINSIAWSPDNARIATGSLDGYFFVWNLAEPTKRINMMNANVGGVNAVSWIANDTLATAGQDCAIKTWKLK